MVNIQLIYRWSLSCTSSSFCSSDPFWLQRILGGVSIKTIQKPWIYFGHCYAMHCHHCFSWTSWTRYQFMFEIQWIALQIECFPPNIMFFRWNAPFCLRLQVDIAFSYYDGTRTVPWGSPDEVAFTKKCLAWNLPWFLLANVSDMLYEL